MTRRKKLLIVMGTRPEVIKLAPVVLGARERSDEFETHVVTTSPHRHMLDQMLETFDLTGDHDIIWRELGVAGCLRPVCEERDGGAACCFVILSVAWWCWKRLKPDHRLRPEMEWLATGCEDSNFWCCRGELDDHGCGCIDDVLAVVEDDVGPSCLEVIEDDVSRWLM